MEIEFWPQKLANMAMRTEALQIFNFLQKYSLPAVQTVFGQTSNQEDRGFPSRETTRDKIPRFYNKKQ